MTRIRDTSKKQSRIKNTGKTEPEISWKKVAEGLKADLVAAIRAFGVLKIRRKKSDGSWETEKVPHLDQKCLSEYILLGTAEGEDENHCLYIAARRVENFWKKVRGYRVVRASPCTAEFYGKLERKNKKG